MNSTARPPRLQDQVRAVIRTCRYSRRTEKSYWYWIRYFIRFHDLQHPSTMGPPEVQEFLTWLAVKRNVAAATQNQALNALVFLYGKVLERPLGNIGDTVRAKRPRRLPVVLSHDEAMAFCRSHSAGLDNSRSANLLDTNDGGSDPGDSAVCPCPKIPVRFNLGAVAMAVSVRKSLPSYRAEQWALYCTR
jgi:hypothetical protein